MGIPNPRINPSLEFVSGFERMSIVLAVANFFLYGQCRGIFFPLGSHPYVFFVDLSG